MSLKNEPASEPLHISRCWRCARSRSPTTTSARSPRASSTLPTSNLSRCPPLPRRAFRIEQVDTNPCPVLARSLSLSRALSRSLALARARSLSLSLSAGSAARGGRAADAYGHNPQLARLFKHLSQNFSRPSCPNASSSDVLFPHLDQVDNTESGIRWTTMNHFSLNQVDNNPLLALLPLELGVLPKLKEVAYDSETVSEPCTQVHPQPCTLNPEPQTLNPEPRKERAWCCKKGTAFPHPTP